MGKGKIVVGVDGSAAAERALLWAGEEATVRGADLVIALAGPVADGRDGGAGAFGAELLREAVATVYDSETTTSVEVVHRDLPAAKLLLGLAEYADLLVVGTRGKGAVAETLLGSIVRQVCAEATCPVVVVGEHTRGSRGNHRIAVGVSPSEAGRDALDFAFSEAAARRAPLIAVRCWNDVATAGPLGEVIGSDDRIQRGQEQQMLVEVLSEFSQRYPVVDVVTELSDEGVFAALESVSRRADLLVLGSRRPGHRVFSRVGPLASRLITKSACPVVITGRMADPEDPAIPARPADSAPVE
jgi:nucleotide-binding universal stress UspA family protein